MPLLGPVSYSTLFQVLLQLLTALTDLRFETSQ